MLPSFSSACARHYRTKSPQQSTRIHSFETVGARQRDEGENTPLVTIITLVPPFSRLSISALVFLSPKPLPSFCQCSRALARVASRHYRTKSPVLVSYLCIMHSRRLITSNYSRKPCIPDIWCHSFRLFLGRQLTPAEKAVISTLEKSRRARTRPRPTVIIDHPGHDSTAILDSYLRYRLATSPEGATAIRCTPDRPAIKDRSPRLRAITYRQVRSIRGSTPAFMLLLNAHRARTYSPLLKSPDNFQKVCSVLFPILDRSGFLIIHLRADTPPKTLPPGLLIHSFETVGARQRDKGSDEDDDTPLVTIITLAPRSPVLPSLCSCAPVSRSPVSSHPPQLSRYAVLRSPKLNRTASAH